MAMTYVISCDACGDDKLYQRAHLAVAFMPKSYEGHARDRHFCNPACLGRYVGNIQGTFEVHSAKHEASKAERRR